MLFRLLPFIFVAAATGIFAVWPGAEDGIYMFVGTFGLLVAAWAHRLIRAVQLGRISSRLNRIHGSWSFSLTSREVYDRTRTAWRFWGQWLWEGALCFGLFFFWAGSIAQGVFGVGRSVTDGVVLAEHDTVLTSASDPLEIVDIEVAGSGDLWLTDRSSGRITVIDTGGSIVRTIDRVRDPMFMHVGHDSVHVLDTAEDVAEVYLLDGSHVSSRPIRGLRAGAALSFAGSGAFVASLDGAGGALARRHSADGSAVSFVGEPLAVASDEWVSVDVKDHLMRGITPPQFVNTTLPVLESDGSLWLVLTAAPALRRYAPNDSLLWDMPLRPSEWTVMLGDLRARNMADSSSPTIHVPEFVFDAQMVRDQLWVLLGMPERSDGVLLTIDEQGAIRRNVRLRDVHGARAFGVDEQRSAIYLSVDRGRSLVRVPMPPELTDRCDTECDPVS